jgi:hypothetical protein
LTRPKKGLGGRAQASESDRSTLSPPTLATDARLERRHPTSAVLLDA